MYNARKLLTGLLLIGFACRPPAPASDSVSGSSKPRIPDRLKLVSWNIEYATAGLDPIADFLRSQAADVICLQEISRPGSTRGGGEDQARRIADRLGRWNHASGATLHIPQQQDCDLAILSKWPVRSATALAVTPGDRVYAIHASLGDGPDTVHVVSVHTHATFRLSPAHVVESVRKRRQQVDQLLERVGGLAGRVLVAGDFNAPSVTPEYAALAARLTDLSSSVDGDQRTFPASRPILRLDYAFGRGWRPVTYQVVDTELSDHRPLVVEVMRQP